MDGERRADATMPIGTLLDDLALARTMVDNAYNGTDMQEMVLERRIEALEREIEVARAIAAYYETRDIDSCVYYTRAADATAVQLDQERELQEDIADDPEM